MPPGSRPGRIRRRSARRWLARSADRRPAGNGSQTVEGRPMASPREMQGGISVGAGWARARTRLAPDRLRPWRRSGCAPGARGDKGRDRGGPLRGRVSRATSSSATFPAQRHAPGGATSSRGGAGTPATSPRRGPRGPYSFDRLVAGSDQDRRERWPAGGRSRARMLVRADGPVAGPPGWGRACQLPGTTRSAMVRRRGPSHSARNTRCHVPSTRSPSSSRSVSPGPNSDVFTWESEFPSTWR